MSEVHATAILEGDVSLGDGVTIGPNCVVRGNVRIGAGTRLLGNCHLQGPLVLGERNRVYPFACLGLAPQSIDFDHDRDGEGLVVGHDNTFREGVTIHRAMTNHGPTRIGDHNYFMANSHAGHDASIGDHCVFANGALLAGHVTVEDRVFAGGNTAVHQFCRVGRGAMLSGGMAMNKDLAPFFMLTGYNVAGSINLVGLRRLGHTAEEIAGVRLAYKTLYRRGLTAAEARAALEEHRDEPMVGEYLRFLAASKRGLCGTRANEKRPAEMEAASD